MTTGLVLGKFAPLHRGHQHLIETAFSENERVIVMVYDAPTVTDVPLSVRARWIRTLYPTAHVIEALDGPQEVGDTPEIRRVQEDYILLTLEGATVDAFYSSEFYGEHVSRALACRDRRVDPDRVRFPVSGTAVRQDPFAHRSFLDPVVYRDLVTRVVLLGAPSTGKTTLAMALAARWRTVWVPEYGREYWERHQVDRRLTPDQLVEVAEGQLRLEESRILDADRFLFLDTDTTTTLQFALHYHGLALSRLHELAAEATRRRGVTFLCGDDIPYDDTWDRSGEVVRRAFQRRIAADLRARGRPHVVLEGTVAARVARVGEVLVGGKGGERSSRG